MHYTLCDVSGRQYNNRGRGYRIFELENIAFFYDDKGLHDHIFEVEVKGEVEFIHKGLYVEKAILHNPQSLLLPETYRKLFIKPRSSLIQKALLVSSSLSLLDEWWYHAYSDKKYFVSYLETICNNLKFPLLQFWIEKAQEENFSLYLYGIASRYTSTQLCDWFFRYGIENFDLCYCRLSIQNALRNDKTLLPLWKIYVREMSKEKGTPPPPLDKVLSKGVLEMFDSNLGSFFSPNYSIAEISKQGSEEDLERLFISSPCFLLTFASLDAASEVANLSTLNFWMKKAVRYGPEFLTYNKALDLAASGGHLQVLEFWSYASALFSFPLRHTSALLQHAIEVERLDILFWWKKYSGKHLSEKLVYASLRKNNLALVKFMVALEERKTWTLFGLRINSCSDEIVQWWQGEGKELFWQE
ncbi:Ankyrin repeat-containing protein [Cedratvirus Zaza IHUMI]|uniref:Ankyrin repeat-containing protein n=1 Tax=Cedratvirus Zaza IHUMI TaxID=2126979 RepID=A0A2R8FEU0_9VIRU|nr:Ankyrin repeat-containing protein [Cedratvirus Zaza IHUMI]